MNSFSNTSNSWEESNHSRGSHIESVNGSTQDNIEDINITEHSNKLPKLYRSNVALFYNPTKVSSILDYAHIRSNTFKDFSNKMNDSIEDETFNRFLSNAFENEITESLNTLFGSFMKFDEATQIKYIKENLMDDINFDVDEFIFESIKLEETNQNRNLYERQIFDTIENNFTNIRPGIPLKPPSNTSSNIYPDSNLMKQLNEL